MRKIYLGKEYFYGILTLVDVKKVKNCFGECKKWELNLEKFIKKYISIYKWYLFW